MASTDMRALGRYQLVESIATGTTATVWRAHDPKNQRDVVIKRFHPHVVADDQGRRRIEQEARNAGRIAHPGLPRLLDTLRTADEFSLVFEHVPGVSLAARLSEGTALSPVRAGSIAADIAEVLAAAHDRSLVHRDIKPANILVGDDGRARLLDFGISLSLAETGAVERGLTGAGLVVGSLPYMAPEQIRGQPQTEAVDVYALGVVLYEMLSGRRPYSPTTPIELVEAQQVPPARIATAPARLMDLAL